MINNQGVQHRIFIYVSVVLITLCVIFAFINITVRYFEYRNDITRQSYLVENNHRLLASRLSGVLKSNLTRAAADHELLEAVETGNMPLLSGRMSVHSNAMDIEFPDDVFVYRVISSDGKTLFSGGKLDQCQSRYSKAVTNALNSISASTSYELCGRQMMQFSAIPIYSDGGIIAAVELGTSLSFYGRGMEQSTGYSMAVLLEKDNLKPEGMQSYGRYYLMPEGNMSMFRRIFDSARGSIDKLPETMHVGDVHYRVLDDIRFYSGTGQELGRFVYAKDVTSSVSSILTYTLNTIFITLFFCVASLVIIGIGFSRTVGTLEKSHTDTINRLAVNERKYREYIDNSPMSIFTANDSKMFIETNKRFCEVLGAEKRDVTGHTFYDFMTEDNRAEINKFYSIAMHEGSNSGILHIVTRRGKEIALMAKAVKIDESSLLFNCLNITDNIAMEKRLRELNLELENVNRNLQIRIEDEVEKNRRQSHVLAEQKKFADMAMMMSAIAHQWRQPLNALGLMIQTMPDTLGIDENSEGYVRFEETAMELVGNMSNTIDNFRLFFETGANKEPFNVIEELKNTYSVMAVRLASHNIKTRFMCRREADMHFSPCQNCGLCHEINLFGSAGEFRQMVVNIFNNSFEAINDRMGKIPGMEGSITVNIVCSDTRVTVSIEDNGTGIAPELIGRIFEPYFSTKNDANSSGIGLYMVKVLTEQSMGGKVAAFNNHLGGLTVVMDFTLYKGDSKQA